MKKILLTAVIASMLIIPLGNTALADQEEGNASPVVQNSLPVDGSAGTAAAESMIPALHGLALAMLNHGAASFDPAGGELAWEGLYNTLSLYGQMDSRCDLRSGELLLPEETVWDFAAALGIQPDSLPPLPDSLKDRITCDSESRCYRLICGDAGLAKLRIDSHRFDGGYLFLDCSLVDDGVLAQFQAVLQPRDNMFGFSVNALAEA